MKIKLHKLFATALGLGLLMGGSAALDTADAGTKLQLKQRGTGVVVGGAGGSQIGGFAIPFQGTCAPGFSKVGEKKSNSTGWEGWMDWYVCSTPVLTCPKQLQKNGKYSAIDVKAIVQMVGGDPDGGTAKFRVQYKCDYDKVAVPEG